MIDLLIAWILGLPMVTTMLFIWFKTSFLGECLILLKTIGYQKQDPAFWQLATAPGLTVDLFTRSQWDTWLLFKVDEGKLHRLPHHLATCPGCLSVHMAYVTGAILWLLVPGVPAVTIILGTLLWPAAANAAYNRIYPTK
jgi:hypothetical protein